MCLSFLAHLSRRLIGELIVCSSVRRCCCRRCSQFSNIFSSETAWPIRAKFYVEPPWKRGIKVCINCPGHMTKMAAIPHIWLKPLKIFSSRTGSVRILKLRMQHLGLKFYKVCINVDPGLTLTYFTARSNLVT